MSNVTQSNVRLFCAQPGDPVNALELQSCAVESVRAGQVLVRMLAAPIHPSDFGRIAGSYGNANFMPFVGGREGVGEVVECGEGVRGLSEGDRVLFPQDSGTWTRFGVFDASSLYCLPKDFPIEAAALLQVNAATAWCLLSLYEQGPMFGAPIIQNAANSNLGVILAQLARSQGFPMIHLVRSAQARESLLALGLHSVLEDNDAGISALTEEQRPGFAVNSVGGESVMRLIKSLRIGGELVTVGGMVRDKVRFPTRELIFRQLQLRGFWMDAWRKRYPDKMRDVLDKLVQWVVDEHPIFPVAGRFSLENYQSAIQLAGTSRWGKVLLTGD
jgi:trans-2-enoyl-CoA reductase